MRWCVLVYPNLDTNSYFSNAHLFKRDLYQENSQPDLPACASCRETCCGQFSQLQNVRQGSHSRYFDPRFLLADSIDRCSKDLVKCRMGCTCRTHQISTQTKESHQVEFRVYLTLAHRASGAAHIWNFKKYMSHGPGSSFPSVIPLNFPLKWWFGLVWGFESLDLEEERYPLTCKPRNQTTN